MATSTPATQAAPNGRPATPPLRAPVVVAPRGRRRPGLIVAGIALAALGALAAAWLVAQAGDRTGVVVVARDVPYGATLTSADLRTADVALDPSVASVPAEDRESLVGLVATTALTAGAVLAPTQVEPEGPPNEGEVLVPLALDPSRVPAGGLSPGDRLLVVDTPPEQADPSSTAPTTFEVAVAHVGTPDLNGVIVLDVVVGEARGPALAERAATGRFALVVLPAGAER